MPKDWAQYRFEAGSHRLGAASFSGGKVLDNGIQIQAGLERLRTSGFNAIRQELRPGTNPDRDGAQREIAQVQASQKKDRMGVDFRLVGIVFLTLLVVTSKKS